MVKFINFGCWNKYGCSANSGLRKVINEALKHTDIDFCIINGDNYYQDKDKKGDKKTVNSRDLIKGFNCISKLDMETYFLLGNHDLEVTNGECDTIKLEEFFYKQANKYSFGAFTNSNKIHIPTGLTMFKELDEKTLIIMIDTNIYAGENPECYDVILPDYNNNGTIPQRLQKLQQKQRELVSSKLKGKMYKSIIICGHHPLMGFKNQKKVDKKGKVKIKGGIDAYDIELYKLLFEVIKPSAREFFYLCADIHNYQEGEVNISFGVEKMHIKQFIVGTGGADLDDDYDEGYDENYRETSNLDTYKKPTGVLTATIIIGDATIDYTITKHWSDYGFIIVQINDDEPIGSIESIDSIGPIGVIDYKTSTKSPKTNSTYKFSSSHKSLGSRRSRKRKNK